MVRKVAKMHVCIYYACVAIFDIACRANDMDVNACTTSPTAGDQGPHAGQLHPTETFGNILTSDLPNHKYRKPSDCSHLAAAITHPSILSKQFQVGDTFC